MFEKVVNKIKDWTCRVSGPYMVFSVGGWRSCRSTLRLHHKCAPHACTECFIRPRAVSVSWPKVDSQLGGVTWGGFEYNQDSCGLPAAAQAPDPWLKVIPLLLRACKTLGARFTSSDVPSPHWCVSNRLMLVHEDLQGPRKRENPPHTPHTQSYSQKTEASTLTPILGPLGTYIIPLVQWLVSNTSTPLEECGRAMLNGLCRGRDLMLSWISVSSRRTLIGPLIHCSRVHFWIFWDSGQWPGCDPRGCGSA